MMLVDGVIDPDYPFESFLRLFMIAEYSSIPFSDGLKYRARVHSFPIS